MSVGAKLFTLSGPVLVYGISSSVIVRGLPFFWDRISEVRIFAQPEQLGAYKAEFR